MKNKRYFFHDGSDIIFFIYDLDKVPNFDWEIIDEISEERYLILKSKWYDQWGYFYNQ